MLVLLLFRELSVSIFSTGCSQHNKVLFSLADSNSHIFSATADLLVLLLDRTLTLDFGVSGFDFSIHSFGTFHKNIAPSALPVTKNLPQGLYFPTVIIAA